MRRVNSIIAAILLAAVLTGCSGPSSVSGERIVSPRNNSNPVSGSWKIVNCLAGTNAPPVKSDRRDWTGKDAEFGTGRVRLGEYTWADPGYKTKTVNTEEYFLYRYGIPVKELNIEDKEINVITVTSGDTFLCDMVMQNNDKALAVIQDDVFSLQKMSNSISLEQNEVALNIQNGFTTGLNQQEYKLLRSGLLLGLRSAAADKNGTGKNSPTGYVYRTLWIAASNRTLHPVLETKGLFLPRKSGFWKVEVERAADGARAEDIIKAYTPYQLMTRKPFPIKLDPVMWGEKEGLLVKKILYIGNDYISTEITGSGMSKSRDGFWQENKYEILPVDNTLSSKGVKISDISGESGLLSLKSAVDNLPAKAYAGDIEETGGSVDEENIALTRKSGHWFMKGREKIKSDTEGPSFVDFNINLVPPQNLVYYDVLCLPWTKIKDKVPEAVDACTSPNKDIAVILTSNRILVYSLRDGSLSETPMQKIGINEGDSLVMAEWSTGEYVDNWENSFLKNKN